MPCPDVPVSKFAVTIRGGKKRGLLVNSSNLCAKKYKVIARFTGQNGKKANQKPKLRTPCKKHKGKHHKTALENAQIGWLVGRIRISLTSTPGRCSRA